jgi:serine/threonine protein kinase
MPKGKFAIADKTQPEIVDYSLTGDDFDFVGKNRTYLNELYAFKDYMKTCGGPLKDVNVVKFIAKGTAGWVFLVERKDNGKKVAMKLIRMTQARSGIREWYLSKVMKNFGISNIVFTDESSCVLERASAPPVIEQELRNAGPVPFYMALFQPLMPWGTLEDIAKDGEINPAIMFKCLADVAETLAAMHAHNVQHRDMKPENVMLFMQNDKIKAARLCDLGRAEILNSEESRKDDIRRFGITFFSVATGEGWTKNRLLKEPHDNLVSRMTAAVAGQTGGMKKCPEILRQILYYELDMAQVCEVFNELEESYKA